VVNPEIFKGGKTVYQPIIIYRKCTHICLLYRKWRLIEKNLRPI